MGFAPFGEVTNGMGVVDKLVQRLRRRGAQRQGSGSAADPGRRERVLDQGVSPARFHQGCYDREVTSRGAISQEAALAALAEGRHSDPFALLGPHPTPDGYLIRTLQPAARAVELRLCGDRPASLDAPPRRRPVRGAAADDGARPTTACASPSAAATSSRSTTRTATAGCSPTSTCTCSAKGTHHRAFEKLGAHRIRVGAAIGVHFAVWAPNADRVSVVGDFNGWDGRVHPMRLLAPAGVWELFVPDLARRREVQVRDPHAVGRALEEERSVRRRVRDAAADRVGRARHLAATSGATTSGWRPGASEGAGSIGRCRSTRCTSGRGRACPRRATAS